MRATYFTVLLLAMRATYFTVLLLAMRTTYFTVLLLAMRATYFTVLLHVVTDNLEIVMRYTLYSVTETHTFIRLNQRTKLQSIM